MLVLLMTAVTGAWAQQETLLTIILSTGDNASFTSGSKTFDNIATVTFSGNVSNDNDAWGWYSTECTLTVTAAEGYTITRVKFYTNSGSAFDEEAPFEAILVYDQGSITKVNGTSIGQWGVNKIEVYGYAGTPAPAASTYTVTLKEGTEDATSWTIAPAEATTTGVEAGTEVKATYGGTKKVKSVKAKKKAPANVAVTSITLNKTATEITVGQTETLSVTEVLPANATDPTYTWKTSDETKATVDQNGVVTAVAAGNVNIYAEANDGSGVQGTCAVTVKVAPTLANTLTNAGMTVKVMYNYSGDGDDVRESSCSFLSKGGGNYDFVEGSGWSGGDSRCAKALVVEDDKLVFKLNMYEDFNDMWDAYGFSVTFDTGNNTYIQWKGSDVRKNSSLISVEVNNQPINNSLTERKITVDDLDTEGCEDWEQIVEKNPDLICADDDDFIRRMTDNAKLMASEDGGNSWYEVLWNDSWEPDFTYKFEVVDETGD